jgi:hypothetical protein
MLGIHYRLLGLIPCFLGLSYLVYANLSTNTEALLLGLLVGLSIELAITIKDKNTDSVYAQVVAVLLIGLWFLSDRSLYLLLLAPCLIHLKQEKMNIRLIGLSLLLSMPVLILEFLGNESLHWVMLMMSLLISFFGFRYSIKNDESIKYISAITIVSLGFYLIKLTWSEHLLFILLTAGLLAFVFLKTSLFFVLPLVYALSVIYPESSALLGFYVLAGVLHRNSRLIGLSLAAILFFAESMPLHASASMGIFVLSLFSDREENWEQSVLGLCFLFIFSFLYFRSFFMQSFDLTKDYLILLPVLLLFPLIWNHKIPSLAFFEKEMKQEEETNTPSDLVWSMDFVQSSNKDLSNRLGITSDQLMLVSILSAIGAIFLWL